jgi:sugar (glycoside-pentoside-hexuronide) transporter
MTTNEMGGVRSSGGDNLRPWMALYSLPTVGYGYMYMLLVMYMMKFSTDVLLIAPAAMGAIFGLSRVWDAVNDPLIGYLSDRTRSRMGRRRPWIMLSSVPLALMFVMAFSPPVALTSTGLLVWMSVALFGTYSGMSMFTVPHMALGAELATSSDDRNRIFGYRFAALTIGYALGLVGMTLLVNAEAAGGDAARRLALQQSMLAAGVMAVMLVSVAVFMPRGGSGADRRPAHPLRAARDVIRNPHARVMLAVTFIDNLGMAVAGGLTLYIAEYVIAAPKAGSVVLMLWLLMSLVSVPFWIRLCARIGRRRTWMTAQILAGVSYGAIIFLGEGDVALFCVIGFCSGFAAGGGGTVAPALQTDVIDHDERLTGERKEGAYFAAWNLMVKSAGGVTMLLIGLVLEWSGFVPNVAQSPETTQGIIALSSVLPLAGYAVGVMLLARFGAHERALRQRETAVTAQGVGQRGA